MDDDVVLTTAADAELPAQATSFRRTYTWSRASRSGVPSNAAVIVLERTSVDGVEAMERGLGHTASRTRRSPSAALANGAEPSPFASPDMQAEEPLLGNGVAAGSGGEQRALGGAGASSSAPETLQQGLLRRRIRFAMGASMVANVALLLAKIVAYALSRSKAVLASTADSFVDIASQVVIAIAEHKMARADPRFPVGRTRLETVGVIACAVIMTIATLAVIESASNDLLAGVLHGIVPSIELGVLLYAILGAATVVKVALYVYCVALQKTSDSMLALAEDHRNDIISNLAAIAFGAIASQFPQVWWVDPAGAILISAYIIFSWAVILRNQVDKIVGASAPEDTLEALEALASAHHAQACRVLRARQLAVDVIRAYHWGARYLVEMEVLLPADMTVRESHDIALMLQHKVEAFDEVERAFVHVDWAHRDEPEHKVDRNLASRSTNLFVGHASTLSSSGRTVPALLGAASSLDPRTTASQPPSLTNLDPKSLSR